MKTMNRVLIVACISLFLIINLKSDEIGVANDYQFYVPLLITEPRMVINDSVVSPVYFCGGSIISRRSILTTATCLFRASKVEFKMNKQIQDFNSVWAYYVSPTPLAFNQAQVKLKSNLNFYDKFQPVNFTSKSELGQTGQIFQYTDSTGLKITSVNLDPNHSCYTHMEKLKRKSDGNMRTKFFCVSQIDVADGRCFGDQGSPIIEKDSNDKLVIIGLVNGTFNSEGIVDEPNCTNSAGLYLSFERINVGWINDNLAIE